MPRKPKPPRGLLPLTQQWAGPEWCTLYDKAGQLEATVAAAHVDFIIAACHACAPPKAKAKRKKTITRNNNP